MFDNLVVQPIFNLLVFITALIPGHNFGIAIIVFTILIRFAMWPLVRKQLHHASAMRRMQPQIKKIKKEAAGDRKKESALLMEMYKERNISPFGSLGTIILQFIVLLGLYFALRKMVHDPASLISFAYEPVRNLPWLQDLASKAATFDETFIGLFDLTRAAISSQGFYWPAFLLVLGSAFVQYKQSVMLMPKPKDGRTLKQIFKDASTGKDTDQTEVSAAVMRGTRFLIPAMILIFTISLASALSLYWFVGGIVAILQQGKVLKQDEDEMEAIGDDKDYVRPKGTKADAIEDSTEPDNNGVTIYRSAAAKRKNKAIEGEVVSTGSKNKKTKSSKAKPANKRRK